jgi:uncharacterized protein (DUF952 family)
VIFHITTKTAWDEAARAGSYRADTLETEGFIHCSSADQVAGVANVRFRGRDDLVLLWIDEARVLAEIKHEDASDGSGTFPHIYGPLDIDAVARVTEYRERDGHFLAPEEG